MECASQSGMPEDNRQDPRNSTLLHGLRAFYSIHSKDGASAEKELYQRQMAMAWSTSGRGGSKSQFDEQVVGGSTGPPRRPPNAGDLSNFGKMNKPVPMTFGPSSVFGKKDGKGGPPESLLSTSGSNMFSILSQNQGIAPATAASTDSLEVQH